MSQQKSVLFICLGNICRSPIAAAVFRHIINDKGIADQWEVDSAATGPWHVGKPADRRAIKTLQNHNVDPSHKARKIKENDFHKFDYIFGMDDDNMEDLNSMKPDGSKAKLLLLGTFDPKGERIIRDPYYDSNDNGFEKCYQQCLRSCEGFLNSLT